MRDGHFGVVETPRDRRLCPNCTPYKIQDASSDADSNGPLKRPVRRRSPGACVLTVPLRMGARGVWDPFAAVAEAAFAFADALRHCMSLSITACPAAIVPLGAELPAAAGRRRPLGLNIVRASRTLLGYLWPANRLALFPRGGSDEIGLLD